MSLYYGEELQYAVGAQVHLGATLRYQAQNMV